MIEKCTSFHTILRLLLRELRDEFRVSQAHINQLLGRSAVPWGKVETGDADVALEHLLTVCHVCNVRPSTLLQVAEEYVLLLEKDGWYVACHGTPLSKDADLLSKEADEYYKWLSGSPLIYRIRTWSVLSSPQPHRNREHLLDVIRWSIDRYWRNDLLTQPIPTLSPPDLVPPAVIKKLKKAIAE
jgi:transcriptional regulator with XRE-family HTH domain